LPVRHLSDKFSVMETVTVREVCKQWPKVLARHSGEEVEATSRGERWLGSGSRIYPVENGLALTPALSPEAYHCAHYFLCFWP
jgi:hypothetical protein